MLRLPNLCTAASDSAMGFLVTQEVIGRDQAPTLVALVGASVLLYAGGVVLNDVFDRHLDARERPERPLPSGRMGLFAARALGWTLLVLGAGAACGAARLTGQWRPAIVGAGLAVSILLYDGLLKRTLLGPVNMGACRTLNVLLGMSALAGAWEPFHLLIAAALGTYVAGVTWFARDEAWRSRRAMLGLGIAVMLSGIGLLAWYPAWIGPTGPLLLVDPVKWYFCMGLLGLWNAGQCVRAVVDPDPDEVQRVVGQRILSIVVLDAVAVLPVRGPAAAMGVLFLLVPALFLGRWARAT
jgi:4-hydroxybenzoate polyprenyltransferase